MDFAPMLAARLTRAPHFPLLATPKVDGVRCLKIDGRALTRSLRPIRNRHIRDWIETHAPDGFDGELTVPGGFHATTSAVMAAAGRPDFTWWIFDYLFDEADDPYALRMAELARLECEVQPCPVRFLLPETVASQAALDALEARWLAEGFEGVVLRDPEAPYLCGRTSESDAAMLKLKRFDDEEGVIVRALGEGSLDVLHVECAGRRFALGTGYSAAQRRALWAARDRLPGQLARFRFDTGITRDGLQPATFLGLRDADDL